MDALAQPSSPSSPLSVLSKSPTPPPPCLLPDASHLRYPSPSSTTVQSGSASPIKLGDPSDEICVRTDGPPPAKRRRIAARKPRTTEHLDLEEDRDRAAEARLDRLLSVLRKKKKIVVVAGAGISVSAGIPDFRSSNGLFTTLKEKHKIKGGSGKHLFDAAVYKDKKSTEEFHTMVRDLSRLTQQAAPTPFHHMLASIAEEGRLMRLYSQNVDCIDTAMRPLATAVPLNAKGPWPTTVQLHGGLEKMVCTKCGQLEPFNASLFEGPEPPLCERCKEDDHVRTKFAGKRSHGIGRLRPRMVLYQEYHPDADAIGAVSESDLRRVPDAVIVVGTSLKVPGVRRIVKEMCLATRAKRDGFTAWINLDPEPQGSDMKDLWDLVVRGKCDDIAELLNLPRWDEQDVGERDTYMVTGDEAKEEQYKRATSRDRIDVLLDRKRPFDEFSDVASTKSESGFEAKSRLVEQVQGIPTPTASPRQQSPLRRTPLPGKGGRTKQSTLNFGRDAASDIKEVRPLSLADNANKVTKSRKKAQPKKDAKPRNDLSKAFKATKNVAPAAKDKHIKPDPDLFPPSSPRSDSETLSGLPTLRPQRKSPHASDTFVYKPMDEEDPSSELSFHSSVSGEAPAGTISPESKPRSMGHLID
ncbi:NAD-dependent protein deacetylase hst4 [Pleurostoma richardsiae]|uniref:NAD-dependent protein deacetylase hst4 n=1 Tax=Pleurostoma richardsiae TaxID=41990 RepID=A0AA38R5A0_9PEZI|nr:NAD-dependent protein deacetylase hst4 [Pleurostoma richardsiae]